MRRVIAIALAGATLSGCSSFALFKSEPPKVHVQLESQPEGADAVTSVGPGCKTPCSVSIQAPDAGLSVTYTLDKYQPITVPVQLARSGGGFMTPVTITTDPNPVFAQLQPVPPPKKVYRRRRKPVRRPIRPNLKPRTAPAAAPAQRPLFPNPATPPSTAPSR
ncbi:MAG: hypothetical protein ACRECL_15490 [Bradyrhizobium sp.]